MREGHMNFYEGLGKYASNVAVLTEQAESINYQTLLNAADELGSHIEKRGLVFVVCKNSFESVAGYLGFLRAGAALVLVNHTVHDSLFLNLLETYQPEYIYLPSEKVLEKINAQSVRSFRQYQLLKTHYQIDYTLHSDLALLLTTSGSTGSPKLVRQSYKNINSNASSIAQYLHITSTDRPMTTMPMSYTYGLSIINSHLLKGASLILTETTLMDRAFWQLMKTHQATTFGGVPYIYEMLKKLRFERMNLLSLRYITQAGGKLSKELVQEFANICDQKNIKFYVMYGQTEATARLSYLPAEYACTKAGSMGIAIPGGKFWLEDETGKVIEENEVSGELVYQGDNVTMGYAESRFDLAKGDENKGILHTGDLAKRDTDGFYYIVGRKSRFLKMFGNRINLNEIEQLVKDSGYECACAGADDHLKIYVVNAKHLDQMKHGIAELIGIHPSGIEIISINKIPRNETGKVL